jgi:hypothetical protein
MKNAKLAWKRKRAKAVPALGIAGLSLSLAAGTAMASGAPAANVPADGSGPAHQIAVGDEELFDVSLATFHVFDKEDGGTFRPGVRLAMAACAGCAGCGGCGGCWTGDFYTAPVFGSAAYPPPEPLHPARKYRHHRARNYRSENR